MPRDYSRIILKIKNIRIQKLQDISENDAQAEGVGKRFEVDWSTLLNKNTNFDLISTYKIGFKHFWKETYKKEGFSWDSNPLVWVIEFIRI